MQTKVLVGFFGIIVVGYFLSSGEARAIADVIWLVGLASGLFSGAAILAAIARKHWLEGSASMFLKPDENGNYPILAGRNPTNYNLIGADVDSRAWLAWMITNNKTGTPPREVAQKFLEESPTIQLPEIREITGRDEAPPILLEAKRVI